MPNADNADLVAALRLRRWALRLLLDADGGAPPSASPAAWLRLLRTEGCAAPLATRLRSTGRPLPSDVEAVLRERETVEVQRVLSARGQLRRIAALAGAHGWPAMVLKGGVEVASGTVLDLADVDVLLHPAAAEALSAALGERGLRAVGRRASHRIEQRVEEDAVQVEIHTGVPGFGTAPWRRAAPLEAEPRLLRMHPADHLHYLVVHAATQHPERRGRIRDLLLIRAAARRATADAALRERLTDAERTTLDLALGDGSRDPFPEVAAARMILHALHPPVPVPPAVGGRLANAVYALLAEDGRSVLGVRLPDLGMENPSALPGLGRLQRHAPRVARTLRLTLRTAPLVLLSPAARPLAAAARRAAEEAGG